jgi:hypothetical protein
MIRPFLDYNEAAHIIDALYTVAGQCASDAQRLPESREIFDESARVYRELAVRLENEPDHSGGFLTR